MHPHDGILSQKLYRRAVLKLRNSAYTEYTLIMLCGRKRVGHMFFYQTIRTAFLYNLSDIIVVFCLSSPGKVCGDNFNIT